MKKVICLSGISGSGKTHRRTTDPALKDLPALDIADVYKEHRDIGPRFAFNVFIGKITDAMEKNDTVVAEAWFRQGSFQRDFLGYIAEHNGWEVEYIEFEATIDECVRRIKNQAAEVEPLLKTDQERIEWSQFINARLNLLSMIDL